MLRLPPFEFRRPTSIREATSLMAAEGPEARVVAGGTDLWPNMKRRHQRAPTVVSLTSVPALRGISLDANTSELRLGATTTLGEIVRHASLRSRFPALHRAVASISSPPLRNMGTIGGNLCIDTRCTYYNQTEIWRRSIDYCMKEAGTICWVAPSSPRCWAHAASDSAPMLCALRGRVRLTSSDGDHLLDVSDLYRDDGIDYLSIRPGEILTEILVPGSSDGDHCRSSFWKLRRRGSIDFAVLSVAAAVWLDDHQRVTDASIYLGAVGSRPLPVEGALELMRGERLDSEVIAAVVSLARKTATPMDNTDFKAQWRSQMTAHYARAALCEVAGIDPGLMHPKHLMSL